MMLNDYKCEVKNSTQTATSLERPYKVLKTCAVWVLKLTSKTNQTGR